MITFGRVESYKNERVDGIYQWPSQLQDTDPVHFSPVYTQQRTADYSVYIQWTVNLVCSGG